MPRWVSWTAPSSAADHGIPAARAHHGPARRRRLAPRRAGRDRRRPRRRGSRRHRGGLSSRSGPGEAAPQGERGRLQPRAPGGPGEVPRLASAAAVRRSRGARRGQRPDDRSHARRGRGGRGPAGPLPLRAAPRALAGEEPRGPREHPGTSSPSPTTTSASTPPGWTRSCGGSLARPRSAASRAASCRRSSRPGRRSSSTPRSAGGRDSPRPSSRSAVDRATSCSRSAPARSARGRASRSHARPSCGSGASTRPRAPQRRRAAGRTSTLLLAAAPRGLRHRVRALVGRVALPPAGRGGDLEAAGRLRLRPHRLRHQAARQPSLAGGGAPAAQVAARLVERHRLRAR